MKRLCFIFMVIFGLNYCSAQKPIYYTIQKGDHIINIANNNKVSIDSLVKWNNDTLLRQNIIKAGDQLIVGYTQPSEEVDDPNFSNTSAGRVAPQNNRNALITSKHHVYNHTSRRIILTIGDTIRLVVDTNDKTNKYEWSSDNELVTKVDNNGIVVPVAKGKANITAKSNTNPRKSFAWKITVNNSGKDKVGGVSWIKILLYVAIIAFVVATVARKRSRIAGLFSKQSTNTQSYTAGNNGFSDQIFKLESEKKRLQEENNLLQRENAKLQQTISELKRKNKDFFEENISLGEELDKLKNDNKVDNINVQTYKNGGPETSQIQSQNQTVLYADAIVDGNLIRVKEVAGDDSIFELHLNNSNTAKVVICKNAVQRIIANPSFIDGCEKQILPNASNVEIVSSGMAKKEADSGKWVVVEKLKINIK